MKTVDTLFGRHGGHARITINKGFASPARRPM